MREHARQWSLMIINMMRTRPVGRHAGLSSCQRAPSEKHAMPRAALPPPHQHRLQRAKQELQTPTPRSVGGQAKRIEPQCNWASPATPKTLKSKRSRHKCTSHQRNTRDLLVPAPAAGCGREDETAVAGAPDNPETPRCYAEVNRDCSTREARCCAEVNRDCSTREATVSRCCAEVNRDCSTREATVSRCCAEVNRDCSTREARCCAEVNRHCSTREATVSTGTMETLGANELDTVVVAEES